MRPGDVRGRGGPEERVQECGSTHIYRACVRACVFAGGRITAGHGGGARPRVRRQEDRKLKTEIKNLFIHSWLI